MNMTARLSSVLLLCVVAGFVVVGGSSIQDSSALAADMDAAANVLAKLDDDWSAAAATRDAEKVAAFYADDCFAYPPNEPAVHGREKAQQVWAAYFAEPSLPISWKTLHAEVARSGELGFTAGTYDLSVKGPDGNMITEKGKYLCTWARQKDGSWKAVHDMWNADSR
ncbi:MAG: DUF4440 domain-containing protein [Phycisphaerae bacterium]|nr:DUF4440 domain-containing protein [Phycisphaerae bacterium]